MHILNHNIVQQAYAFANAYGLIPPGSSIVVGFSGGPDSVFLLHLLQALRNTHNLTLYAAHLNHEWRGPVAEEDALFCKNMAESLGISYVQARLSTLSNPPQYEGSREAQGRAARRQFLTEVQQKTHSSLIALAHHADDQQETFFIRLIRGASLSGLVGMAPKAEQYIRPLLGIYKQQILAALQELNIPYQQDLSNYEPDYLRNRIRTTVLPALKTADQRFDHSFAHTLSRLQETEDYLRKITETTFAQLAHIENSHYIIDKKKFLSLHATIQERILVYWLCAEKVPFPPAYGFLREMIRFIESPYGGNHTIHHAWQLTKKGNLLTINIQ
jgi:tRNA(Ile)-lysidine synthase